MSATASTEPKLAYRPDIDGLRAVAVLAVIANHLPQEFLPSGFLGVDVFFVISGFVVSASVLGQRQATFQGFYLNFLARRVKRLLPALIVCTAIIVSIVFLTDPFPHNSIVTGISGLFGLANITLFNLELDYFSPSSKFNAFTHTWSLGVEEQFYIVFPLIVWLTVVGNQRKRPGLFPAVIALISLISMSLFLWLYRTHLVAAYYLMPTRFWQLGVGALAYVASTKFTSIRYHRAQGFISQCALVALLLCFFAAQDHARWSSLIIVILTGVLLMNRGPDISSRALSLRPAVYVGKISYSLYLWHWPVIALGPLILSPGWRNSGIYIVAMTLAAVSSYHFVERPLRVANWTSRKGVDIATGFACSFVLGLSAYVALIVTDSPVAREAVELHPAAFLPILGSGLPYETCIVDEKRPMTPQTFEQCTIPPKQGSGMPMIWVMGDSHSAHLQGMLYELHDKQGFGVHLVASPGHAFPHGIEGEYLPRQELFDKVLDHLKPGDIVLVARLYLARDNPPRPAFGLREWIERVPSLARELQKRGVTLVLMGPPPMFSFTDVRECNIAERGVCAVRRAEIARPIQRVLKKLYALQHDNENIRVFDIFDQVCSQVETFCYPDDGISFLYRDRDHFNSLGSKRLAEPFTNFLRTSGIPVR